MKKGIQTHEELHAKSDGLALFELSRKVVTASGPRVRCNSLMLCLKMQKPLRRKGRRAPLF